MVDFTKRINASASEALMSALCPAIDRALAAKTKAEYDATRGSGEGEVAKKRIGAGYIGVECERELAFRFHKYPKEERESAVSKGELQRHAESGHWTELRTAEWLRLVGFQIRTDTGRLNTFGKPEQIGWKAARDPETGQYRMAGEVDGIIDGFAPGDFTVPEEIATFAGLIHAPCIWESKKGTDKKWKKFCKEKVKGADPKYYGQLQSNMAHMGVEQTLFSMLNLDNMKYYFELITLDPRHAQNLEDRAVRVIVSREPFELPRLGRAEDDFKCKFCDFFGQCWQGLKLPMPVEPEKPTPPQIDGRDMSRPLVRSARPVFTPPFKI